MDFIYAPNEARAQDFLKHNRFGLDDRAQIRTCYAQMLGEVYTSHDTLYVLDGVTAQTLTVLQMNVAKSKGGPPRLISVEER